MTLKEIEQITLLFPNELFGNCTDHYATTTLLSKIAKQMHGDSGALRSLFQISKDTRAVQAYKILDEVVKVVEALLCGVDDARYMQAIAELMLILCSISAAKQFPIDKMIEELRSYKLNPRQYKIDAQRLLK